MDNLESERQNTVRSRNLRLTALRTFLRFAGRRDITALHTVERALNVPMKRFDQPLIGHLTRPEIIAILGDPGDDWISQRDHLLFTIIYNTGDRVSEVINIRVVDVVLDGSACVHLNGKGRRKDRYHYGNPRLELYGHGCEPIRTCTVMRHCFLPNRGNQ
ncbi:hypothetical protein AB6G03_11060 [Providencia hangzhouensis]|uniref:hypothetical protein n=1 Tax=Providencia hangzhouensis TaxID=3031799 RepID=UPI0034DD50E0